MSFDELAKLGYALVVDPLTPFFPQQRALRLCYEALAKGLLDPTAAGRFGEDSHLVHEVIDLETLLEIEGRTVDPLRRGQVP